MLKKLKSMEKAWISYGISTMATNVENHGQYHGLYHGISSMLQNLGSIIKTCVKRWLHMHQGANFDHLKLPPSKIGLDFQLPSDVFKYCKLSIRNMINKSKNQDMKTLLKLQYSNER